MATPASHPKPAPRRRRIKLGARHWKLSARHWKLYVLVALAGPCLVLMTVVGYYYVTFSRMIEERMHGELQRVDPRVFARPFEIRRGQSVSPHQLVDRLNELGYANRARAEQAGEFTIGRDAIVIIPREGNRTGQTVRVVFGARSSKTKETTAVDYLEVVGQKGRIDELSLDAPVVTALITGGREKRRDVPLQLIPKHMVEAVLAIEDRRFYEHVGIDPIGIASSVWDYVTGRKSTLRGASTLTQQLVINTFLTRDRSPIRKLQDQLMAVILERKLSKDQVLELYLNDVWLGQRGSFAVHGVAEASRLLFGKHISNVSLAEAALIAGTIQSPPRYSPFDHPDRAKERRNLVLRAMVDAGFISEDAADRESKLPVQVVARALESEAPYFVDFISQELHDKYTAVAKSVDVYTTLDLHLQRLAHDAVRDGLVRLDEMLARRKRRPQAALIAIDPRNGEILALVGGRSYNQSQYNRVVSARRQPGSVFKPFVYLAAFEHALEQGRTDLTPATVVMDEPTTFMFNDQPWDPGNYEGEYDGPITLRRALALSRNIATIKVAETTGYGEVAALWRRVGTGTAPRPYPAIALGVFEATPMEIASAYTLFANGGTIKPLHAISRMISGGQDVPLKTSVPRTIARRETTFLVLNMMRSVLNEGTGAGARGAGFTQDAAGKSGTTNDLRDAWFVGFTPELLTVVWVGLDDNQPLGLSGTQAALPIWTSFMMRALAGLESPTFQTPEGITFADIDRDTGLLAGPTCPRVFSEAFIQGTEPREPCHLHGN